MRGREERDQFAAIYKSTLSRDRTLEIAPRAYRRDVSLCARRDISSRPFIWPRPSRRTRTRINTRKGTHLGKRERQDRIYERARPCRAAARRAFDERAATREAAAADFFTSSFLTFDYIYTPRAVASLPRPDARAQAAVYTFTNLWAVARI